MIQLYQGDCLEVMDELIKEGVKVDMILTDPPYGTTSCKWDSIIPLDKMWERLDRLIKPNGAIILFGQQPFTSFLVSGNPTEFRHNIVWHKDKCANFIHSRNQPRKTTEDILIFSKKGSGFVHNSKNKCTYNPQMIDRKPRNPTLKIKRGVGISEIRQGGCDFESGKDFISDKSYPENIVYFKTEHKNRYHPTQKPVALLEYLIKTYSNKSDLVLDFTMGSGSTGVACLNTSRDFIGIELDEEYFKIAQQRINKGE